MSYHQLAEFSSQNEGVRLSHVDQTKLFNGSSQGEIKISRRTAWIFGIGISAMIIFLSIGLTFAIYDIVQLKTQQNLVQESEIQTFEDLINTFPGAYENLLDFAIVNGNTEWVKFLLKNIPNNTTKESIQNSLHTAIQFKDKEIVKHLLHNGANINGKNKKSMTPLHFAEAQMAKFLIHNGANITAKDNKSWTPLFYAVLNSDSETAQLLIDHGAKVNTTDQFGKQPLQYAALNGYTETSSALIENGANVNAKDHHNVTALHEAARYGDLEIVKLLVNHGADITAKTDLGKTALDMAKDFHNTEISKYLQMN